MLTGIATAMVKEHNFMIYMFLLSKINVLAYDNHRIVGGHRTTIKSHPHMVAVVLEYPHMFIFRCGGGIISKRWVLTAAHCHDSTYTLTNYRIFGGGTSWINGYKHRVSKVIIHEGYSLLEKTCDIALVQTIEPFILAYEKPIPFAHRFHTYLRTTAVIATGWGKNSEGGDIQDTLVEVHLSIYDHASCKAIYKAYAKITDKQFCLYARNKDTCQGDSGGPIVQNGVLIGIVSFGIGCAKKNIPGVYTKVSVFDDWIIEKSGDLSVGVINYPTNICLLFLSVIVAYVFGIF